MPVRTLAKLTIPSRILSPGELPLSQGRPASQISWTADPLDFLKLQSVGQSHTTIVSSTYPPRQKAASFNLDSAIAQLGPAIKTYAEKKKEAAEKEHADRGVLAGSK